MSSHEAKSENPAEYQPTPVHARMEPGNNVIIKQAIRILEQRMKQHGEAMTSPDKARQFLTLKLAERKAEVFSVMFLDTKHRLIEFREMFNGTIDGAEVHPREVARAALETNAAAVILAHNHPSGVTNPSAADQTLTQRLQEVLSLFDVRVLDHVIVGGTETSSFAERGLL